MRMRSLLLTGAAATAAMLALGTTVASAATLSDVGTGFVGKGEVQSAFAMNNKALQDAVNLNRQAFTFTTSQTAVQSLSSTASQTVTEHVTQSVHRVLSCTVTVGGDRNPQVFVRDGERFGSVSGTREGTRDGSRAGSLDGAVASTIAADPRKTGQWTGWTLTGFQGNPTFTATGVETFDAAQYGDPTFIGDTAFGDVEWGGWVSEPGTNPASCDSNGPGITDVSDVTTYGDAVPGATEYGPETFGPTEYGATTGTGPMALFVTYNGTTKPLAIAVPAPVVL